MTHLSWLLVDDSTIFPPKSYTVNFESTFLYRALLKTIRLQADCSRNSDFIAVHLCLYPITSFRIKSKNVLLLHALRVEINFKKLTLSMNLTIYWQFKGSFGYLNFKLWLQLLGWFYSNKIYTFKFSNVRAVEWALVQTVWSVRNLW